MSLKKLNRTLLYMLSGLCLLSFARVINSIDYWVIDILSNFPFQYALLSLALMSICIWKKAVLPAILSGILFLFNISAVIEIDESIHAAVKAETTFKVYSANIYKDNWDFSALTLDIQKINPEIVSLLEVSIDQFELLQPLKQSYPYSFQTISKDVLGVVLLSKFPLNDYKVTRLSEYGNLLMEARVTINQKSVKFYGFHAQRPRFGNFKKRSSQFLRLARQINEESLPVIVAGDFNATPFSPLFRELLSITKLIDTKEGFGWQPSWPTFFPPLWIPIDHVLVTPDIQIHMRNTGSYIGSDHYPVITELSLG